MLITYSCQENLKCGAGKVSNGKVEFNICKEIFNQETIFIDKFDTIAFHLPKRYKIIEAKQSFNIVPSIWAKDGDEVGQYMEFYDLKMYCTDSKELKIENNILLNPLDIDENVANELYFKNKNGISKNELLVSLQKQFNELELFHRNSELDEYYTASDKKEYLTEIQREREIYNGYIKNYIDWKNTPSEQFELLAIERFLTLTIQKGGSINKLTFIYNPVYGN